jgi:hypothetical protein
MKNRLLWHRINLIVLLLMLFNTPSFAQWTTSGTNIHNSNSGNVGINNTNPQTDLDVGGSARLKAAAADAVLQIDAGTGSNYYNSYIALTHGGIGRWKFGKGNDANGHFVVFRYNDDGSFGGTPFLIQRNNGFVGINQTNPQAQLHVTGGVKFDGGPVNFSTSPDASNEVYISRLGGTDQALRFDIQDRVARIDYIEDGGETGPGDIRFRLMRDGAETYNVLSLSWQHSGSVGIGTETPAYKLDVSGTARAEEIVVETSGADFVFEDDYDLRSLEEVEQFISEHGHLPEIPSAEQMQAEGMQVGDMQTRLLQKIEELTLYIIAQEKRAADQQEQLSEQRHLIELLMGRP